MSLERTIRAAQEYLHQEEVDCLVYHYPCCDGSGAAVSGWLARGESIEYMPLDYSKPFDDQQFHNKNVVFIDCALKKEQLLRVRETAKKVMVLDHHDSAEKNLRGVDGCFFCMENSGAILGWHYFHGLEKPAPDVLQLIEDRDLWKWAERERSEPLYHAILALPHQPGFKKYCTLFEPAELEKLIEQGRVIMQQNKDWCVAKITEAQRKKFQLPNDAQVYDVISLEVQEERLVSELSEELYNKYDVDFILLWYELADHKYKLSFRNNKTAVNVGDIASSLGGGGHPRAAGATISFPPSDLLS
jgi:oligoribonuclease NrnB/cAMP/cGMP phosphodiesterase (DHH superfamily)